MRLVDGSIKRPVTVFMVTVGIVLFGMVAASRLAVDLLPDISYPSLTIRTDFPDAAPGDVEQFVTRPVEEGVGVVPGLSRMHSISRAGQSEVTLEFASNTRMDLAALAVREKLDLVVLPRETKRPAILKFDPSLDPVLRLRLSGGENLKRLRRIADETIKRDLEGAQGVAAVKVAGGEEEEIQVEVDAARLSAVGLTLADVTRRLAEENVNLAGGSLTEGRSEYLVRATNQFLDPAEIGDVVLATREGGVVRLSDVAGVRRGAKDPEVAARVNGAQSVEIAVYKEGDANTVSVARAVRRRREHLPQARGRPRPPAGGKSRRRRRGDGGDRLDADDGGGVPSAGLRGGPRGAVDPRPGADHLVLPHRFAAGGPDAGSDHLRPDRREGARDRSGASRGPPWPRPLAAGVGTVRGARCAALAGAHAGPGRARDRAAHRQAARSLRCRIRLGRAHLPRSPARGAQPSGKGSGLERPGAGRRGRGRRVPATEPGAAGGPGGVPLQRPAPRGHRPSGHGLDAGPHRQDGREGPRGPPGPHHGRPDRPRLVRRLGPRAPPRGDRGAHEAGQRPGGRGARGRAAARGDGARAGPRLRVRAARDPQLPRPGRGRGLRLQIGRAHV